MNVARAAMDIHERVSRNPAAVADDLVGYELLGMENHVSPKIIPERFGRLKVVPVGGPGRAGETRDRLNKRDPRQIAGVAWHRLQWATKKAHTIELIQVRDTAHSIFHI